LRLELISVWDRLHAPSTSITMEFTESGIETDIRISEWKQPYSAMYINLFRNYGWSIKTLDVMNGTIDDSLAQLLDESTEDKGTKLEALVLDLKSLSFAGLRAMDQVVRRSQGLCRLAVTCAASDFEHEEEKAQWFLEQHREKLTRLCLRGPDPEALTQWLEQLFPSRRVVPILSDLQLRFRGSPELQYSSPFIQWLVRMISAPHKPTHNSIDGSSTSDWLSLQRLYLNDFKPYQYEPRDWRTVLKGIDFSGLEDLDLEGANFGSNDVELLVELIRRVDSDAPLKSINLSGTPLSKMQAKKFSSLPFETLRKKAPSVKIVGLSHLGVN